MKKRYIAFLFLGIVLLQLACGAILYRPVQEERLDTVLVNEIVRTVMEQWDGLAQGQAWVGPEGSFDLGLTVLTQEGEVLLMTKPGLPASVHEAVAYRETIVDFGEGTHTEGKLLIDNEWTGMKMRERRTLAALFLASCAATLLAGGVYLIYISRTVIDPFRRLRRFAMRVAGGDLDFPMEMDRENVFGAFTESFDMMREELRKAREQEKAANRSKKELVAKLSHDIKTPVASIQAVAELMSVSARTEKERSQLWIICEKAGQIDALISDMFHAALEELNELPVEPAELSSGRLGELLENADYQRRAVCEKAPECMLVFDSVRLQQVFDNIFSNSYKYAAGKIYVSFSFADGYLEIAAEDDGQGITEEELPLLMGKFYRGQNAAGKSGAGLGLYISKYFLEQMGGKLVCRNTNRGFCVSVFLKLA